MRPIRGLRWWIAALLFCSTVINYVDRQALSILARTIQDELQITDLQYTYVVQAFLVAYTLTFLVAGRITDWLGTRVSFALFITWWSIANILTALSRSALSLGAFRFLLGMGEPGNYTAAPKVVAEWFPPRERGLVVGIYTAGATVGATIAGPLVAALALLWGWRSAFVATGLLGLLWLVPWLWLYRRPEQHPRLSAGERAIILSTNGVQDAGSPGAERAGDRAGSTTPRWTQSLRRRETWLLLFSRVLTDPVWYFYLFWYPKYMTDARHLTLAEVGQRVWIIYLAADFGALFGGWISGRLIRGGLSPITSRKRVMLAAACVLPLSPLVALAPSMGVSVAVASLVVLAHLAWQVTLGVLIVDLYPSAVVATVVGVIAVGSGIGGVISTGLVGYLVTSWSYTPVFVLMGVLHPLAALLILKVRDGQA